MAEQVLRVGGVALRGWLEDDAPAVHAACQDPEIQRWIPEIPRPYTLDDARAFVAGLTERTPQRFAVNARAGFARERVLRSHTLHPDGRRRDAILYARLRSPR